MGSSQKAESFAVELWKTGGCCRDCGTFMEVGGHCGTLLEVEETMGGGRLSGRFGGTRLGWGSLWEVWGHGEGRVSCGRLRGTRGGWGALMELEGIVGGQRTNSWLKALEPSSGASEPLL